jgi:hypothetical protein
MYGPLGPGWSFAPKCEALLLVGPKKEGSLEKGLVWGSLRLAFGFWAPLVLSSALVPLDASLRSQFVIVITPLRCA